jgi:hypothetical protein
MKLSAEMNLADIVAEWCEKYMYLLGKMHVCMMLHALKMWISDCIAHIPHLSRACLTQLFPIDRYENCWMRCIQFLRQNIGNIGTAKKISL